MEKVGYLLLLASAAAWLLAAAAGMLVAFPVGMLALPAVAGVAVLFIKALRDRLSNREDDHYANTVDK